MKTIICEDCGRIREFGQPCQCWLESNDEKIGVPGSFIVNEGPYYDYLKRPKSSYFDPSLRELRGY